MPKIPAWAPKIAQFKIDSSIWAPKVAQNVLGKFSSPHSQKVFTPLVTRTRCRARAGGSLCRNAACTTLVAIDRADKGIMALRYNMYLITCRGQ